MKGASAGGAVVGAAEAVGVGVEVPVDTGGGTTPSAGGAGVLLPQARPSAPSPTMIITLLLALIGVSGVRRGP
jgi:hypothetical protein